MRKLIARSLLALLTIAVAATASAQSDGLDDVLASLECDPTATRLEVDAERLGERRDTLEAQQVALTDLRAQLVDDLATRSEALRLSDLDLDLATSLAREMAAEYVGPIGEIDTQLEAIGEHLAATERALLDNEVEYNIHDATCGHVIAVPDLELGPLADDSALGERPELDSETLRQASELLLEASQPWAVEE